MRAGAGDERTARARDVRQASARAPAPGGPSRHIHVVALDVNGGRGASMRSLNGLGTQQIEILDGTSAFSLIADEVVASAHDAWQHALHLHRHEVTEVIDGARERLDALRPGIRFREPLLQESFSLAYAPGRLTITYERRITRTGEAHETRANASAAALGLLATQPPLRGFHAEVAPTSPSRSSPTPTAASPRAGSRRRSSPAIAAASRRRRPATSATSSGATCPEDSGMRRRAVRARPTPRRPRRTDAATP